MTQSSIEYMGLLPAVQMARAMKEHFGVQAFLHLDHAQSLDLIQRCLDAGFDSVMIDASEKPFDQNVALSQQVVQKARAYGACVEAELGYVAKLGQSTQKRDLPTQNRPEFLLNKQESTFWPWPLVRHMVFTKNRPI